MEASEGRQPPVEIEATLPKRQLVAGEPEEPAIDINCVSKKYGKSAVLKSVSLTCSPGTVVGFVGPNGAGKSTTLRIAAGLTRATSGTVRFEGSALRDLPVPGAVVGFCLDASALHPGRTAGETLRLGALINRRNQRRATEMLDMCGLASVARRPVRKLSLGMRQRLAIAWALMGEPRILVLDEPVNGLDIEGVRWIRQLMVAHAQQGGTVLLSSHLLKEVEAVADQVFIIDRGEIVAEGSPRSLGRSAGTFVVPLSRDDFEKAMTSGAHEFHRREDGYLVEAAPEVVSELLLRHGVVLRRLTELVYSLEETFLDVTSGEFVADAEVPKDQPEYPRGVA